MQCPFCEVSNLEGAETCSACGQDLTSFDGERSPGRKAALERMTLRSAKLLEPIVLSPDAPVLEAVERMRRRRLGSVFIVEDGGLVGVFTEADLLSRVEPAANLAEVPLSTVMTRNVASYKLDDTVSYAMNAMACWGNRHLPIMEEDGHFAGFVGIRTVLNLVQRSSNV